MQKEFINGVPYFTDKTGALYLADDSNPIHIGKHQEQKINFHENLIANLQERLTTWRAEQSSRVRKPTAPSSRKSRNAKAGVTEVSDHDE